LISFSFTIFITSATVFAMQFSPSGGFVDSELVDCACALLQGGGCLLKAISPNKAHGNLAESMPATGSQAGASG
jgi:hypothetical protein